MTNTFVMPSFRRQYVTSGCRLTQNRRSQNRVLPSDNGSNNSVSRKHTEAQKGLINLLLSQSFDVAQAQSQAYRRVMLTIHLRPGLRLRMGAVIPLPPPYAFRALTGKRIILEGDFLEQSCTRTDTSSVILVNDERSTKHKTYKT
jgi:hypothetical protein